MEEDKAPEKHEHYFKFCALVNNVGDTKRFVALACNCGEVKFEEVPA